MSEKKYNQIRESYRYERNEPKNKAEFVLVQNMHQAGNTGNCGAVEPFMLRYTKEKYDTRPKPQCAQEKPEENAWAGVL